MPLYDYTCKKCGQTSELLVSASEAPKCPGCGSKRLERLVSAPIAPGKSGAIIAAGRARAAREQGRARGGARKNMVSLSWYLGVGALLFAIGVVGIFLNRRNLIVLLMAIELMLLAVNMNFVAFSHYLGDYHGQVFVFFILTVAAAEAAIGLAILVTLFRNLSTINVDELDQLKG